MWILLTFIAVLLWSLVNIADNYLVEKNKTIGHPVGALVIFSSIFAFIVSIIIYLCIGNGFVLNLTNKGLLIVAGFCNLLWIVFYLNALSDDDVSSVVPWFLTVPLFGYVLGYYILGETLLPQQILGGGIILLGGIVLAIRLDQSTEKNRYHVKWKPILYMLIASCLIALWMVLFKFVANDTGFWPATFWEHIGLGIAGVLVLVLIKSYRQGFFHMLKRGGRKTMYINAFSETATIVGNLLANFAILSVPVTLVLILEVSQPVIVFVLGIICTLFFPNILTENISKRNLLHKGISITIMIIGGLLLM